MSRSQLFVLFICLFVYLYRFLFSMNFKEVKGDFAAVEYLVHFINIDCIKKVVN